MVRRAARLLPDSRLAQLAAAGDERAFEVIYDRHHRALLGFCRHMVGAPDEAEDALQQAFLRAHRALVEHGPPDDLRPWLFAIARNRCKTLLAARRAEAEVEEGMVATAGLAEEVQVREDLQAVVADVAQLPDDQRAALVLSELADLSYAQIGDVIGVRSEKVKALVHQARTTLIAERDAREQPCEEVREQLATARGGALRRGPLRRHLRLCPPCRAYRDAVADQRRTLALVLPVAPSVGLKAGIVGAATGGGGVAAKLAATAIVIGGATGGGVAIVEGPAAPAKPAVAETSATPTPSPWPAATVRPVATAAPVISAAAAQPEVTRTRARARRRAKARARRERVSAAQPSTPALARGQGRRVRGETPVKVRKAPGSSRSVRAPAKKAMPVRREPAARKPEVPPGQVRKQQRQAAATPTPTPPPTPTPRAKAR